MSSLSDFNISVRSFINLNDLIFPIKIHIKDIVDDEDDEEYYKVNFIENKDDFKYSINTDDEYFKEEYEATKLKKKLLKIHKFIDFEMINYDNKNIAYSLKLIHGYDISNFEEFVDFIYTTPGFFSPDDITKSIFEINFYIGRIKNKFIDVAKNKFDWDRNFPNLKLKSDGMIDEYHKKFMVYPELMTGLQPVSEYPMNVWFEENIGKAFNQWSWREKELKKIYITMKSKIENFSERAIHFNREKDEQNHKNTRRR